MKKYKKAWSYNGMWQMWSKI